MNNHSDDHFDGPLQVLRVQVHPVLIQQLQHIPKSD